MKSIKCQSFSNSKHFVRSLQFQSKFSHQKVPVLEHDQTCLWWRGSRDANSFPKDRPTSTGTLGGGRGGGQTGGFQFQPKSWNTCSSRSVKDTGNDLRNDFGGCTPLGLSFWNISLHFCPVSAINILEHFVLRAVRSHRSQLRCSLSAHRTLPDAGTKNLEAQYSAGMHETYGPARRRRWGFAAGAAGRAEFMNR